MYNKLGILTIYKSPKGNFTNFLNRLELILQELYNKKCNIVICGDVNVNDLIDNNIKSQLDAV
jgi:exonuclease III